MKLQRAIGQTSQILLLYVQDATVSTGAGLANVVGSTVSYTWFHNNQISVSTGTASTAGTTGTYSTSAWVMISSSAALGWYQFGAPDGVFATGDSVGIHFYVSSGPNAIMAPLPVEIELVRDNPLQFSSSKVFLAHTSTSPANVVQIQTSSAATAGNGISLVSTQALTYTVNVSAWANSTVVATSSGVVDVNLVNIWNKSAVTSNPGILTVSTQSLVGITVSTQSLVGITTAANVIQVYSSPVVTSASGQFLVSTQSLSGIVVSTQNLTGITTAANVIQVYSSPVVTSASGQFRVSTQAIDKGGYGVTTNADKLNYDITSTYGSALVTSGAGILNVSTQTLAGAGSGDIISIYGAPIVTSGAGILNVSTQKIDKGGYGVTTNADKGGYGVTTNADKTGYSLTAGERASIMDVINTTVVGESYRVVSTEASITQLMYEVLGNLTSFANSGTIRALGSVTSGVVAATYLYDSTTPSAITRIS